jgi:kynureninase
MASDTPDVEAIKARLEESKNSGAMHSACGEYECDCHRDMPALLSERERLIADVTRVTLAAQQLGALHLEAQARALKAEAEVERLEAAARLYAHNREQWIGITERQAVQIEELIEERNVARAALAALPKGETPDRG